MRTLFNIGDLLVTEIKNVNTKNQAIHLQIRNEKFGKLRKGILVPVNSCLIKKMNTHFQTHDGITMIFALNGFIWLESKTEEVSFEKIAKMKNLIVLLSSNYLSIHPKFLCEVYDELGSYSAKDLLLKKNQTKIIESLRARILAL